METSFRMFLCPCFKCGSRNPLPLSVWVHSEPISENPEFLVLSDFVNEINLWNSVGNFFPHVFVSSIQRWIRKYPSLDCLDEQWNHFWKLIEIKIRKKFLRKDRAKNNVRFGFSIEFYPRKVTLGLVLLCLKIFMYFSSRSTGTQYWVSRDLNWQFGENFENFILWVRLSLNQLFKGNFGRWLRKWHSFLSSS